MSGKSTDPNIQDINGRTRLHIACKARDSDQVAELLADPRTDPNLVDECGNTALIVSILDNDPASMRITYQLIGDLRTEPNITNKNGWSALTKSFVVPHKNPLVFNLVEIGADCRKQMRDAANYLSSEDYDKLKSLFKSVTDNYHYIYDDNSERSPGGWRTFTLVNCAAGQLPQYLAHCVAADAKSGMNKTGTAIALLSPFWKDEYKQVIRVAEATQARTSLLADDARNSALENHIKKDNKDKLTRR